MKKVRWIVRVVTAVLCVALVVGFVILITDERDATETLYQMIGLAVGATGALIAVVSQVDSYHREKLIESMQKELGKIERGNKDILDEVQEEEREIRADLAEEKRLRKKK